MNLQNSSLLKPGQIISERYRVNRYLGKGGAGTVFLVEQVGLEIPRALKLLIPSRPELEEQFLQTFQNEVSNLSQLTHRNIIKILDYSAVVIEDKEYRYFVMEFAKDGELSQAIPFVESRTQLLGSVDISTKPDQSTSQV